MEDDGLINVYETAKVSIRDENKGIIEKYDRMKIVKIHTSLHHDINEKYKIYDDLLTPLHVLLTTKYDKETKNKILKEYGIKDDHLNKEVDSMCNLSEVIEAMAIEQGMAKGMEYGIEKGIEQGIEKGIEQGIEKGMEQGIEKGIEKGIELEKIESINLLMKKLNLNIFEVMDLLEIKGEDRIKYEKLVLQ